MPTVQGAIADLLNSLGIPQRVLLSIFGFLGIINASALRLCLDTTLTKISNSNIKIGKSKGKQRLKGGCEDCTTTWKPLSWSDINKRFECECNKTVLTSTSPWTDMKNIFKERSAVNWSDLKESCRKKLEICKLAIPNEKECPEFTKSFEFDWSKRTQTIIIIAFYVGYVISQIPGGILAQKYGGKCILTFSIITAAILTILTPVVIQYGGLIALIILRILIGLCEGPAFPALSALLARWVPPNERGKLGSFALSGSQVGIVFVNIVCALMLHILEWPMIFYFFGACALIWALFFVLLCSDEPTLDPYIQPNECIYLQESISNTQSISQPSPIPWKEILINVPVWAMISSAVQYNWAQAEGMTSIPKASKSCEQNTLKQDLNASVRDSMPHIINCIISILSGSICDVLVEKEVVSTTVVRKIMAAITALGPKLINDLRACLTCTEHDDFISKANCAIGVIGTFYAGAKLTPLDLSPNYAGILMAISNGIGSLSAILLPQLEEHFPNSSFYRNLRSTLCLISALLTSGEVQNFDSAASIHRDENYNYHNTNYYPYDD